VLPEIQTNKNALLTNQFCQVLGYDNIYAVGECATIAQSYLQHKWAEIFDALDEDKNGTIDANEFKVTCYQ
jgi:NADH:ubiquinone reductase (non-electrogenic)